MPFNDLKVPSPNSSHDLHRSRSAVTPSSIAALYTSGWLAFQFCQCQCCHLFLDGSLLFCGCSTLQYQRKNLPVDPPWAAICSAPFQLRFLFRCDGHDTVDKPYPWPVPLWSFTSIRFVGAEQIIQRNTGYLSNFFVPACPQILRANPVVHDLRAFYTFCRHHVGLFSIHEG